MHGAAGVLVINADRKPEHVADAAFQRQRVGILLHPAGARFLRLPGRYALLVREMLGLANAEAFLDDALRQLRRVIGRVSACDSA